MTVRSLDLDRQTARLGVGALQEVGALAAANGIHHALLVTDDGLARTPWLEAVRHDLRKAGVDVTEYRGVSSPPVLQNVTGAVAAMGTAGCDGVVSLGGGSVHDVAKAAALLARSDATLHQLAHGEAEPGGKAPHVAVSTTAGTGAERSAYAFITDEHGREHTVLHHPSLVPEAAVIDPRTHATLPARATATTGLNALAHAVEAYLSTAHTDASDARALVAVQGIRIHLPRAVEHGDDLDARAAVAEAAYHAAEAFDEAGLGLVDSISLVLTALFDVDHGTANALLLPHVLAYDADGLGDRAGALCDALGVEPPEDAGAAGRACVDAVRALEAHVGVGGDLHDLGVSWDDLYLLRHAVLHHPFTARNPRPLDEAGLAEIFAGAVQGVPRAG